MSQQLALELEAKRLSRQCARILEAFKKRPLSRREITTMYALNATARISDLRKRGHDVRLIKHDHATGDTLYALFVNGERVA